MFKKNINRPENIQKLKNQRRLRLCEFVGFEASGGCNKPCKAEVDAKLFDFRNFMAHAGFDNMSVCVRYEEIGGGVLFFDYDEKMWGKILSGSNQYLTERRKP